MLGSRISELLDKHPEELNSTLPTTKHITFHQWLLKSQYQVVLAMSCSQSCDCQKSFVESLKWIGGYKVALSIMPRFVAPHKNFFKPVYAPPLFSFLSKKIVRSKALFDINQSVAKLKLRCFCHLMDYYYFFMCRM